MTDRDDEQRYYYSGELPCRTVVLNHPSGKRVEIEYARSFKTSDAYLIQEVFPALVTAGVLSLDPPKKG